MKAKFTPKTTEFKKNGRSYPVIELPHGDRTITLGVSKCEAVLQNIEAVKAFIKNARAKSSALKVDSKSKGKRGTVETLRTEVEDLRSDMRKLVDALTNG